MAIERVGTDRVLPSLAKGGGGWGNLICTVMEACKGGPYRLSPRSCTVPFWRFEHLLSEALVLVLKTIVITNHA
jgi:hypothetical protein